VSVWVALSKQSQVELGIWSGPVVTTSPTGVFGTSGAAHTSSANSIRIGEKLHLALVTIDLSASPLTPAQIYSYGGTKDLNSEALLVDNPGTPKHLALGYQPNQLPSFATAPVSLEQLKLIQGS
jgi:hypothetical protein